MCWTFNHQNIIEMAQGHISLSISPFLVIYANTSKSNKKSATSMQLKTKLIFAYDLAYLDHSLAPLGLFLQIRFFFLYLSQTHLFGQIERYSKGKIDQVSKTPPFPIIKILPNSNSMIFKIHKWLANPFALALISPPLALSTKTGSFLAL
jgi:hypothetical protein